MRAAMKMRYVRSDAPAMKVEVGPLKGHAVRKLTGYVLEDCLEWSQVELERAGRVSDDLRASALKKQVAALQAERERRWLGLVAP